MASLITCAGGLGTHGINGRKQGRRCNNSSSSAAQVHLPWATRALTYSPIFSSNSKRLSTISPTASVAVGSNGAPVPSEPTHLSRKSFPDGFVFGAATSSYQIEGAWDKDGKGPSVWDHYCHSFPEKIKGQANGDEAVNSYELYEDDVKMLNAMGMKAYRFSVSWPRILKTGKLKDGINHKGINYYNNLINKLKENGIEPYITLFHWETPQALDEEYGSFLSKTIVDDFKDYAEVCFKHFGDRVKHWFTFNEPYVFCTNAYGIGKHAPGRCSIGECAVPEGDSLVEPYKAGHNLLLAHAKTVHLYRTKYKDLQKGKIGIALVSMGYKPYDNTTHVHEQAQNRSIDFNLGWFMEPLSHGDYPFTVKALVKERLPSFTIMERKLIKGSFDMIGLNYYTSRFSRSKELLSSFKPFLNSEDAYSEALDKGPDGKYIGQPTGASWLYSYPEGLKDLLMIMMKRYGNPEIFITENGVGDIDNDSDDMDEDAKRLSKDKFLNDTTRMQYLKDHLAKLKEAIDAGVNVRGHFTWSLMDNFEWHNGYTQRFGLIYVDRKNGFKREMKKSAEWFAVFNGVAGGGEKIVPYESSASPVRDNGSTGDNNIKTTPGSNNGGLIPSDTHIDDSLPEAASSQVTH